MTRTDGESFGLLRGRIRSLSLKTYVEGSHDRHLRVGDEESFDASSPLSLGKNADLIGTQSRLPRWPLAATFSDRLDLTRIGQRQ